jgi:moderate conductance mechanosensitive channel
MHRIGWCSLPRMRWLLPLMLLLLLGGPGAWGAVPPPATPVPPADLGLTPAELRTVLDVLNDPQKRAAFTSTLQALAHATKAAAPAPASPVPLAPNSVGAQVIAKSAGWLAELGTQVSALNHVLGNLPAVWAFTVRSLQDPETRADLTDAGWHLGVVVLVAGLVEVAFRRLLRPPLGALARWAPHETPIAVEPAPDGSGVARQRRFARTVRILRRVPFVLARLVLEVLPVATFLLLVRAGLLWMRPDSQDVLWLAVTAYIGGRLAVVAARAIFSPSHASLRVLPINDQRAAYAVRWIRWLAVVAIFGAASSSIASLYGLPAPAREAFLKAVILIDHVFLIVIVLQCRAPVAGAIRHAVGEQSLWRPILNRVAQLWHVIAIFLIAGVWLVWAAKLPNGYEMFWRGFGLTLAVGVALRVLANILLGGLDRLFRLGPATANRFPGLESRARVYVPLLHTTVHTLLWVCAVLALLQVWGVQSWHWLRGTPLGAQLSSAALSIIVAGVICLLVWEAVNSQMERNLAQLTRTGHAARAARLRTLMPILRTVVLTVLITAWGLNLLGQIGVNVAPLLAGAGIVGVAIGFGSQKLVQDFITGIFLLLENAMQVGDWVTVAGLSGSVENLSIRTMRLRAGDGAVHIIPFSNVGTVTNVHRGVGNVPVNVTVSPDTDTDWVAGVLGEIAQGLRKEQRFADMMRSDFQLWGVDKVEAGAVTIAGQIVCTDGGRYPVQREFNRRLNIRFREEGIVLVNPAQTVVNVLAPAESKELPPPDKVQP